MNVFTVEVLWSHYESAVTVWGGSEFGDARTVADKEMEMEPEEVRIVQWEGRERIVTPHFQRG